MFGGHDWSASGMSNCEMCDYGGIGRCCRESDDDYGSNDDEPVHALPPTKTIKTACARPAEPAKTVFVIADRSYKSIKT